MNADTTNPTLSPTALSLDDAARLLSAAGGESVPADWLQADLDDGAPTNSDCTLNLVQYAAWLLKEASNAD